MLLRRITPLMTAVLLLCSGAATAFTDALAPWADELGIDLDAAYSATRTMRVEGQTMSGTEHRTRGKTIFGMSYEGMTAQMLLREDLGKYYVLMPQMGMYREIPRTEAQEQAMSAGTMESINKVGSETVNGQNTTVYDVVYRSPDDSGKGRLWVNGDGILVKMRVRSDGARSEEAVIELTNLKIGAQDPALFEIPPHLKPFSLGGMTGLGALMQGGMQGAPGDGEAPSAEDVEAQMRKAMEQIQEAMREAGQR